jgi:hypothetical protein
LGINESINGDGRLHLIMDGGRAVEPDPNRQLHLDYGYAVTSHSSQGQTADHVLIHVDTELAAKGLLNSRKAYSQSRVVRTTHRFSRTTHLRWVSNSVATCLMLPLSSRRAAAHHIEQQPAFAHEFDQGIGMGT